MKNDTTSKHYRVVRFYKARHEASYATEEEARRAAMSNEAESYTQVWAMDNETDGTQVALYESQEEIVVSPAR